MKKWEETGSKGVRVRGKKEESVERERERERERDSIFSHRSTKFGPSIFTGP